MEHAKDFKTPHTGTEDGLPSPSVRSAPIILPAKLF